MVVIKENKQYSVNTEDEQKQYLAQGYDIWDKGKLIKHSPVATVPYEKYQTLLDEKAKLVARLEELDAGAKKK